ncbi:unknown [Haloarcula marismortui ATCC 43049]|nr:unknown [Haloarcula marismortui ATCC 43049]
MILPTVRSEAQSAFADELADRGFESIERGRRERVRVDSGDRARLRTYSAELDLEAIDATLSITGWVGVWHGDGFRIAAGAYPDRSLATLLSVENPPEPLRRTPSDYRAELLSLIRAVA